MTQNKESSRIFRRLPLVLAMMVISLVAGCNSPQKGDSIQIVASEQPVAQILPDQQHISALVAGNNEFALDLQRELFDPDQNLIYSPWSISEALAMTYAGARNETEQEMAEVMHFTLPQGLLHPSFHAVEQALMERGDETDPGDFQLKMANAIWAEQSCPILDSYLGAITPYYRAAVQSVNFQQREETRRLINRWGSDQTERRIAELIPPGVINGETGLVLTNAVYFRAAWKIPFRQHGRHQGQFQLLDGSKVTLPMMSQVAQLSYGEQNGLKIVELPYHGDRFSMVIMLPQSGRFETLLMQLDNTRLSALLDDLKPTAVGLEMPPFNSSSDYLLRETLQGLGMIEAFRNADFSGITGTRELFVRDVCHSAFVSVDENGTEAAAATGVVIERKGAPRPDVRVAIDRPFLYLIRDKETGSILFLGHLVDPSM
jgi:serpin B